MADVDVNKLMTQNPTWAARVAASFERQAFMGLLGARLVAVEPGGCDIELPFRPELAQQHGFFHGGVIGTLADNACGYASFTLATALATLMLIAGMADEPPARPPKGDAP